ncbi:MAG: hypothetical protein PHU81_08450 [Acidobacteriota bacterium]|nr:hypothetical protein [Acidobacteriota bacterium]
MAGEKKLLLKLLEIINNNYTESNLEELILHLVKILMPAVHRTRNFYFIKASYDARDIAFLTVSSLLVKNRQGRFPALEKAFNWRVISRLMMADESNFQAYLNNILLKRLRQTYSSLGKEIRPERARIKKEIVCFLKNSKDYCLIRGKTNGQWLVRFEPAGPANLTDGKKVVLKEIEQLLAISLDSGLGGLQIPKFFRKLAVKLNQSGISFELFLNELLILYLQTQQHYFKQEVKLGLYSRHRVPVTDLNEVFATWLDELRKRNQLLLLKYVEKKKLAPQEKDIYCQALDDLFADWSNGGQEHSLFYYLQKYQPQLSPQGYRQDKRKIMEYLVKSSRNFLKNKIYEWQSV